MLMNVRKTRALVENVLIPRAHTPVTAELATRAHLPGPSVETLTSVYRTVESATTVAASTRTAVSTVCVTRAFMSLGMERTVKIWMNAA